MSFRRRIPVLFLLLLLPLAALAEGGVRVMVVSDLHYLSPSCYEESDGLFVTALSRGDGKMSQYSRELLSALLDEARHQRPDALLVTGDLTFNGELVSHEELSAAFAALREEGIPVWVIPGNHDINNAASRRFPGHGFASVPNITPEDFGRLYEASLGPRVRDGIGFSYTVPLGDRLRLVMCDAAVYDPEPMTAGYFSPIQQEWLAGVLSEAQESGAQVITVSHQNLLCHTSFLADAMMVQRGNVMKDLLTGSGACRLGLTGHLHIQHIAEEDGFFEIATGAYCVPPFRYGLLTAGEDGSLDYEARELCPEHLPEDVYAESETWFEDVYTAKSRDNLLSLGIPEEEADVMMEYASRLNHAYFRGDLDPSDPSWTEDPAFALWQSRSSQTFGARYLISMITSGENTMDALHLSLPAP